MACHLLSLYFRIILAIILDTEPKKSMKSLLITFLITGVLFLAYDLFIAAPESRDVFTPPAETAEVIANLPVEAPPADPLAGIIAPSVSKQIEQIETKPDTVPNSVSPTTIAPASVVQGEAPKIDLGR